MQFRFVISSSTNQDDEDENEADHVADDAADDNNAETDSSENTISDNHFNSEVPLTTTREEGAEGADSVHEDEIEENNFGLL